MWESHHLLQLSVWPEFEARGRIGGLLKHTKRTKIEQETLTECMWVCPWQKINRTWPAVSYSPNKYCFPPTLTLTARKWQRALRGGRGERGGGWGTARNGGRGWDQSPKPLCYEGKQVVWIMATDASQRSWGESQGYQYYLNNLSFTYYNKIFEISI